MNLITAEFNLISFALLVIAGIIGIVRSTKKSGPSENPPSPEFLPYEQQEETKYTTTEEWMEVKEAEDAENPSSVTFSFPDTEPEEKNSTFTTKEEEETQDALFDIRQAVISSEILRRPEF